MLEARKKKTVPKNAGTTVGQTYTPANFPFKTAKIKCSIDERMLPGGEISKRMGLDTFLPMDAAVVESDAELYRIVDEIEYKAIIKTKKVIGTKGLAKLPKGAVTPDSESEFGASFAGELAAALEFGRQHAKRFKAPLYIIRVPNCKGCLCATSDMGDTLGGRTGKFYKEMKKFKSAISSYNRALSLNPNYAEAFYNKGLIQSYMNDTNAAIESYNQALKIKPSYVEALFKLGESFKLFGENNNAAKCFEAAVNLDETDAVGAKLHLATLGRSSTPSKTPEVFMKNFYKKRAQIWDNQSLDKYSGHLLIASAFGQANIKKESHILDLGCGTGSLANFLRPYAKSLVGIDLSHEMLAYARETKLYDLLIEKDIELYLAEKLDHYDIVVAAAVFIHFLNLERGFKLITRSLKKNGQFIFTVFESLKEDKHLNDFLMYSHSADYISSLVEYLDLKVIFRDRAIHEYHKETAIYSLVYVLQKTS